MVDISLNDFLPSANLSRELDDIFSGDIISRAEALSQVEREKRMKETNASDEFDKLLRKPEIRSVFIRLKDR